VSDQASGAADVAVTGETGPPLAPVRIGAWVRYRKEEVFEACGALALAEVVLRRLGWDVEAAHMAEVFEVMEGGLAR
jgi:hypothetical protein